MPRQTSMRNVETIELMLKAPISAPVSAYKAAQQTGINLCSFYKSRLYKLLVAGKMKELHIAIAEVRTRHKSS